MADPINAYLRVAPPADPDSSARHLDSELSKIERTTRELIAKIAALGDDYATLADPIFTGDPQAPTPLTADDSTSIATTEFVKDQDYATNTDLTAGLGTKADSTHTHAQSDVTGLVSALAGKEPTIAAGTTTQYWRGDKTWQTVATPLVRRYYDEYTAHTTLSTTIPFDDTIPTSSEGNQVLSRSVLVDNSTQRVRVTFRCVAAGQVSGAIIAALFRGTTCIGVSSTYFTGSVAPVATISEDLPGAAGSYTYSVRIGSEAGAIKLNGMFASRVFGGAAKAVLVCEVLEP